ncbi:MAG: extracellular repeat protein family [Cellvibrio sp.]|nr:extracellular repeat protein family [Cellvibrio sp.]
MRPVIEFLLIGLLITTSAVASEVDRATPPDITRYCTAVLGVDSGLDYVQIVDLNRRGQALGWGYLGEGVEVFLWDRKRGYKFIDELAHELEVPARAGAAFNDRGQIVGTRSIGPDGAFLRAVIWKRGKGLRFLEPAPGDENSVAVDINNRGEVAGISGPYPDASAVGERSVIWDRHSRVTVIPEFPDSTGGQPYAMNEAGQVIGANNTPDEVRGYIWDRETGLRAIEGVMGGGASVPSAINDHGDVVGTSSSYGSQHAIFWSEETGTLDLGDLPGGIVLSHAYAINNHRQIVGNGTGPSGGEAVIWDSEGQIHNLNELLIRDEPDDQYLHMLYGRTINDAGWITAFGFDTRDRRYRTFLLKPARLSSTDTNQFSCGK